MKFFPFAMALLLFSMASQPGHSQGLPPGLDALVKNSMETFQVPGLAVAIVKDGKVIAARGYGVRELGKPEKVDENTLFGIASNSKAFTAAALAILVDDGKIEWDVPVHRYLPEFRMYDPYASEQLTVRDLLVHRSGLGLGAGDLLHWPDTQYTPAEILERIRYIKPATSFRSTYAYDNVLYLVAGMVVERVSGQSWGAFLKARIFDPLDMKRAFTNLNDFKADANHVSAHAVIENKLQHIPLVGMDQVAPAAAVNCSVADLALWVKAQLNDGLIGEDPAGARIFSEQQSIQMHMGVTPMPLQDPPPELAPNKSNFKEYALGWSVRDYRGHKMVSHSGALLGQVSMVTQMPEQKLGVIVLTNQQSGGAFLSITLQIIDHYLGVKEPFDWVKAYATNEQNRKAKAEADVAEMGASRDASKGPSLPLSGYAGSYQDAWYGNMTLALEGDHLVMRFSKTPLLTGDLELFQHDTFIVRWRDRSLEADAYVTFSLEPDGSIERIRMKAVSEATDFSFDFHDLLFVPEPQP